MDLDGNPTGHEFIGAIKTNHWNFPKQQLEDIMNEWPSGSSLVLECHRPNGVVLLAIGYKYNSRKVLCFVATKDAGMTKLGDPYNAKFPDQYGNVKVREVDRPAIVSTYFQVSNKVDRHNHVRQYLLKLEKLWVTENPWFRIVTTIIGMTVVDAWLLVNHQSKNTDLKKFGIVDFADSMAYDLIHNKANKGVGSTFIPSIIPIGDEGTGSEVQGTTMSPMSETTATTNNSADSFESYGLTLSQILLGHQLVDSGKFDPEGRAYRRRCFTPGCLKRSGKLCNHRACRDYKYTFHDRQMTGKFFCPNCHEKHKMEVASFLTK